MGFPCVGAWVTYGLGTENQNLPAFVAMYDTLGRGLPKGHAQNWGAGFLPGVYQGTALNAQGAPIDNLVRPAVMSDPEQRRQLDLLRRLSQHYQQEHEDEAELSARVDSFELAYRMQMAAPEALDVTKEPEAIQKLYGLDNPKCAHFAKQVLMARRLVERGVRFVQIYSGGMENERSWDGHIDMAGNHRQFAGETDIPIGGLLTDLKQRGLLDSTLVIWGGEFGRLPLSQRTKDTKKAGRDHNPHAFTTWFAGGGVKGGVHHGETDEIGHKAAVDRVSVNDLHATILALAGPGSHEADVQVQRPQLPADRRGRRGGQKDNRVGRPAAAARTTPFLTPPIRRGTIPCSCRTPFPPAAAPPASSHGGLPHVPNRPRPCPARLRRPQSPQLPPTRRRRPGRLRPAATPPRRRRRICRQQGHLRHPPLARRRPQPHGPLRHEAGRPGRIPRPLEADPNPRPRLRYYGDVSPAGEGHGQILGRALAAP